MIEYRIHSTCPFIDKPFSLSYNFKWCFHKENISMSFLSKSYAKEFINLIYNKMGFCSRCKVFIK